MTRGASTLRILSAGAAKGVVQALAGPFEAASGTRIDATFDSAGAIRNAATGGSGYDLVILPAGMLDTLAAQADIDAESINALGRVLTGIAVAAGDPLPDVHDAGALKAALAAAGALYCPDTVRSTAGIHFAGVLRKLGIHDDLAARFHTVPNGATAMRELALSSAPDLVGCTQITEINYTDGVDLVGALPGEFELSTVYTAAVGAKATLPALAGRFIAMLAGAEHAALRRAGGFEAVGASVRQPPR